MTKPIPAIYENGLLRPLTPIDLCEKQTVWLQVLPNQTTTEPFVLLESLYNSGLLSPNTTSDAQAISDADLAVMVQSIDVTGQPISETIIEDRGEW
jgi:predicted DNA-binding antitoxin AbrB/MazE fold protein